LQPYKRDNILQKRPTIFRSLLIVGTPYTSKADTVSWAPPYIFYIYTRIIYNPYVYCNHYSIYIHEVYIYIHERVYEVDHYCIYIHESYVFHIYTAITTPYIYTKYIYSICILQSLLHICTRSMYVYTRMCVWSRPLLNIYTQIIHIPYIYCNHYSIYIHKLYIFHIYTAITTVYVYTRYIYICKRYVMLFSKCIYVEIQGSFVKT